MADVMDGTPVLVAPLTGAPYYRQYLWPDGSTERAQVMYPASLQPVQPVYCLLFFHGKGGDEDNFNLARSRTTLSALMSDGNWIVVQSNAGGVNCGNQLALDSYKAAWSYAARTYPIAGTATYGQSMGGLPALLTLQRREIPGIFAHVGISALADMRAWWDSPTDPQGSIRNAYFPTLPKTLANYLANTVGHDPMLFPAEDFAGIAVQMIASPGDSSVDMAQHSAAWIDRVAPHVPEAVLVTVSGGHLSRYHYPPDTQVTMPFLMSHAPGL
jgi:hypothetical protein